MPDVIINADDFGISRGVNLAIYKAHTAGIVNSASLMVNQQYVSEAVKISKSLPKLALGLHLNLTNGRSAAMLEDIPLLVGKNGCFKNGFVKLLLLSLLFPQTLKKQVECETEAQIKKALAMGVSLAHIDSHRHVHAIPLIFKVVGNVQQKYNIPRIRIINENIFRTLKMRMGYSWLFNGGIIKYAVLSFLAFWNKYPSSRCFYSILYTGKITRGRLLEILKTVKEKPLEIMVHPGMPGVDKKDLAGIWDKNILLSDRTAELNAVLDNECRKELENDNCKNL